MRADVYSKPAARPIGARLHGPRPTLPAPNKHSRDTSRWCSLLQVLTNLKSSYLAPFLELQMLIEQEAFAAEDNLRFLQVLEEPCQQLAWASPRRVRDALPRILHTIRFVWNFSRYNNADRMTRLLSKVCRRSLPARARSSAAAATAARAPSWPVNQAAACRSRTTLSIAAALRFS